jgi:hypothetical protein
MEYRSIYLKVIFVDRSRNVIVMQAYTLIALTIACATVSAV